ncbi:MULTISPECIES: universal stress protein [Streptomyces]|jgi:nucleotide-binding universal stress UspA family protein|uniref:universal stress protein n=1 Tax=Streptomyces TaxID=1883 RepID=UPI0003C57850|nr:MULTISPECIES: universal stress protein [Streptomyces]EST26129.1 hypothetical protein M877_19520 [Streptomyces niveus NCIMB 11891]TFI30918.1 universal stress protein [Streptomyces sp. 4R-3d]
MGRIVVGVDGSASSVKALHWAVRQAGLTGDTVEAAIGWEYPASAWATMAPGIPPEFDPEQLAGQILDETLESALGKEGAAAVDRQVVGAPAAQALLDRAEGAVLLVVGDRGYSGFKAALLGSVSLHVTQHATVPVVVVRGE